MHKEPQTGKPRFVLFRLLALAFKEMKNGDPLRMAGATAFFTTFALPPIVIILFQSLSLFLNKKLIGSEMMKMLTHNLGKEGAAQIRQTTRGFGTLAENWFIAAVGFMFLLFVATTLFTVIKNTLNDIWNIKVKEKPGILFNLWLRARSLGVILAAGVLFVMSVYIDSFRAAATDPKLVSAMGSAVLTVVLSLLAGIIVVTAWFTILFRYLADGRPSWKATLNGALLTGILFSLGRILLSFLLRNSNINTIYGTSTSIVLVLLFVFYSSFILYFGASFIKVFSDAMRQPIEPINEKSFRYRLQKVD